MIDPNAITQAVDRLLKHIASSEEQFLRQHTDKISDHYLTQYPDVRQEIAPGTIEVKRLVALVPHTAFNGSQGPDRVTVLQYPHTWIKWTVLVPRQ